MNGSGKQAMSSAEMQGEQNNAPDNEQRLFQVVQDYLAELERGAKPNRDEWLARHPDLSPTLAECFDSLDFLRSAAGAVSPLGPSPPWNLGVSLRNAAWRLPHRARNWPRGHGNHLRSGPAFPRPPRGA